MPVIYLDINVNIYAIKSTGDIFVIYFSYLIF